MKYLSFIPLVLVASCASRPQIVIRSTPPPVVEPTDAVRYGEIVRAYHIGRYVDPHDTMHEQHPVYRLESSAHWNLKPVDTVRLPNSPQDPALASPLTNDVLVAEMNRQRDATTRVIQEAVKLSSSLTQLQSVISEMRNVARSNALLSARLATNELRLAEFNSELQKLSTVLPTITNDVQSSSPEPTKP